MYNIHDSTVYLYFFIILANKVACLLACNRPEFPETLILAILCNIFGTPSHDRWGDRIQILTLTQCVHGAVVIHLCVENKPIRLSRLPANRFITLLTGEH